MKADVVSKRHLCGVILALMLIALCIYTINYAEVYDSISITTVKTPTVEYGNANYDYNKFINEIEGNIVSVKKDITTTKVGLQELVLVVSKGNVSKEIPITVEVKDTIAPEIIIKEESIQIDKGYEYDLLSNIERVYDNVDGDITYKNCDEIDENDSNYFTISSDFNYNVSGEYTINIYAVDKNGNETNDSYKVTVVDRNLGIRVASMAYNFIGSPYVAFGNSPAGFDCSGFVQYIYSGVGISVSRSAGTQLFDGVSVNYDSIVSGDILVWGYADGTATHSALYVGNGQMIHAANPSMGVIISDVKHWLNTSGTQIIGVRRIV